MRKRFYNDILIAIVICVLAILLFNSCKAKKEILETHIESRDSVCNIKETQNIVLVHEDSVHTSNAIDLSKIDTSKECSVKFNDIETKYADGSVSYDRSITVYGKKNSIYTDIDKITKECSVSKDSSSVSIDSTAVTEQHIDTTDQTSQKSERKFNTWHTFWFWVLIMILLCIGLLESERRK